MSLRARLLAYLAGLHLVFIAFSLALFADRPALLIGVEIMVAASLAGGVWLVGRALEPLAYMRRFHDLLQEQEYAARLQPDDMPEFDSLVSLFNAMLAQLHAERLKIGEQQGFLDRLLEATPSAVIVFDFDGGISLTNASANAMLSNASLFDQLNALPRGESRILTDDAGRRYRGQRGHFFDRGFARDFLMVEELTEELERSERAAYEKLIRVLAHEVNNTVAATGSVLGSLLFYSAQLADPDRKDFTTAVEAVKRRNATLGEFIERFTHVVKMPAPELRPESMQALADDIIQLYREPCRARGITIEWAQCEPMPALAMDRALMEQALINIVKNAMEAVDRDGAIRLSLVREGQGARLSVSDSGNRLVGIPAHQLFAPFFTTKRGGQGIGLMFVREVLSRHNLSYRLAPTSDGETRFDIHWRLQSMLESA